MNRKETRWGELWFVNIKFDAFAQHYVVLVTPVWRWTGIICMNARLQVVIKVTFLYIRVIEFAAFSFYVAASPYFIQVVS